MAAVASLVLAVGWVVGRPGAQEPEPTPPPAAVPPLTLPPNLPARAEVAASAASPLGARALPALAVPGASPIGAEGYGPHIDAAHAGNDPQAAWEAVRWLRQCETNAGRRHSFEALRNQGVSPEMMTQLMVEADTEARRCQTVTPQHRALVADLASRAMRAGVPEAAAAVAAATFPADLDPAQRQEVAEAMRRDAQAGDPLSLINAATSAPAWGLGDAERLIFLMAYAAQTEQAEAQTVAENLIRQGRVPFSKPPTRDQIQAAGQAARDLLARRAARRP